MPEITEKAEYENLQSFQPKRRHPAAADPKPGVRASAATVAVSIRSTEERAHGFFATNCRRECPLILNPALELEETTDEHG